MNKELRVVNSVHFIRNMGDLEDDGSLKQPKSPIHPRYTVEPATVLARHYRFAKTFIRPTEETFRSHIIQIHIGMNKWIDLFEIKPSTIAAAGHGLFASRAFSAGQVLGIYFGTVHFIKPGADIDEEGISDEYSISGKWKHNKVVVLDAFSSSLQDHIKPKEQMPPYFGLHFMNDPTYNKSRPSRIKEKMINVVIGPDFVAKAKKRVEVGDELFMSYNLGDLQTVVDTLENS